MKCHSERPSWGCKPLEKGFSYIWYDTWYMVHGAWYIILSLYQMLGGWTQYSTVPTSYILPDQHSPWESYTHEGPKSNDEQESSTLYMCITQSLQGLAERPALLVGIAIFPIPHLVQETYATSPPVPQSWRHMKCSNLKGTKGFRDINQRQ